MITVTVKFNKILNRTFASVLLISIVFILLMTLQSNQTYSKNKPAKIKEFVNDISVERLNNLFKLLIDKAWPVLEMERVHYFILSFHKSSWEKTEPVKNALKPGLFTSRTAINKL